MKLKAFILFFLVFFLLIPAKYIGQSVGYLGKRVIIKTNVVNGIRLGFNNADIEVALSRRFSLNGFFEFHSYSPGNKGVKARTGIIKTRNAEVEFGSDVKYREYSTLKNGTTQAWTTGLGAKLYFKSFVPAPYGFYTSIFLGYGNATFKNYDVTYNYTTSGILSIIDPYDIISGSGMIGNRAPVTNLNGEAKFYSLDFPSIGYQRIFKGFIALDFKLSLLTQYCKLPDNLANALEHNYYLRANTVTFARENFSFGPNVYVKLGFLIF